MSYEKQERSIHEELAKDVLKAFNDKIIAKASDRWMCVSSTSRLTGHVYSTVCTSETFYCV